jgi:hypothetical protein
MGVNKKHILHSGRIKQYSTQKSTASIFTHIDPRIRIAPQQITHQPHIRHITRPMQIRNLLQPLHLRTQPAMHAQNFLIYNSTDGQTVEHVAKHLPQPYRVPPFAFVVKSVDAIDPGAFVIASQYEKVFGIHDFVADE